MKNLSRKEKENLGIRQIEEEMSRIFAAVMGGVSRYDLARERLGKRQARAAKKSARVIQFPLQTALPIDDE